MSEAGDEISGDVGFLVRGRVQGVGFRWWAQREAERAGIVGSVRNLEDGGVEVIARGRPDALMTFEEALRRGPPMADVEAVYRFECTLPDDADHFRIERR